METISRRLARRYPQLLLPVAAGMSGTEQYKNAVLRGIFPEAEPNIPGTVEEAAEFIKGPKEYSTGQRMRLRPMDATVMTEVEAVESLADVKAMVFSAGGLEGAAGSISLAVRGEKEEVEKIIAVCESVKGKTLPPISEPRCMECCHPNCHMAGTQKPWVKE